MDEYIYMMSNGYRWRRYDNLIRSKHATEAHAQSMLPSTMYVTWNEDGCLKAPRLPYKVQLHLAKCHVCHTKATATAENRVRHQSQPVPRETKVDASKCHACHAKCSCMSPSATPATQKAAATTATAENRARHQSQSCAIRAMPATWNEDGYFKVPRLPRKVHLQVPRLPRKCSYMSPSATPVTQVQLHVAKYHACHAKSRGDHGDRWEPSTPPEPTQCHTCHACHMKWRWMSQSATPATQSAATRRQVPRLPRKKPRRPRRPLRTERATRASPAP